VKDPTPKNLVTSGTTEDVKLGGNVPKKRPLRAGETVWRIRPRPEPPPGWRPEFWDLER